MRKFASNRRDVPAFQGCDESCTAEGGYPALCEMYPETHHEGCPRQRNAAASLPPAPPTTSILSDERTAEIINAAKRYASDWDDWATLAHKARFLDALDDVYLSSRALRAEVARQDALLRDVGSITLASWSPESGTYNIRIPDATWQAVRQYIRAARSSAAGEDRTDG